MLRKITAEVITCPGRLHDNTYRALEIVIEGVNTPYHCVLALPASTCRAISEQIDTAELYDALADAINSAGKTVRVVD